jgi:hypothetical protein
VGRQVRDEPEGAACVQPGQHDRHAERDAFAREIRSSYPAGDGDEVRLDVAGSSRRASMARSK